MGRERTERADRLRVEDCGLRIEVTPIRNSIRNPQSAFRNQKFICNPKRRNRPSMIVAGSIQWFVPVAA
jgi:hypothetical protein